MMHPLLSSVSVPFAVHIGQDMIRPEWCAGGFAVALLLVVWGTWRTRDEEIARVAVLTSAFFVASYIHVPVPGGPPAHLLLTGLVGVVLGRRAALAIPVGLLLQAVLLQHGALSALGANVCVMTPPALLSWLLFKALCNNRWLRFAWFRALLVMVSAVAFVLSGVYAVTLLVTNWGADVRDVVYSRANDITFHPAVLLLALAVALAAAWLERRSRNAVEFPVGLVIGELSVLLTLLFNALFLIVGGHASWHSLVLVVFLIHLPLAVLEGVILGFTVGFLARVKPEMLVGYGARRPLPAPPPQLLGSAPRETSVVKSSVFLLAVLGALASPGLVHAHKLSASWRVLPDQRVQVQSYFPTGVPPRDAAVKVTRPDGSVLAEGNLDDKGLFVFRYAQVEDLTVEVLAAAGTIDEHTAILTIPGKYLTSTATPVTEESWLTTLKEFMIGIGFLLAAAAFVLSLRNYRQLQALRRTLPPPDGDRPLTR
jgi:cobalt/nickel transport system permease protein